MIFSSCSTFMANRLIKILTMDTNRDTDPFTHGYVLKRNIRPINSSRDKNNPFFCVIITTI
jgi:hypothetical protein